MPSFVDRWIEEGLVSGRAEGRQTLARMVSRQLWRCFGPQAEEWSAPIGALETKQLEKLGKDLLAFRKPTDIGAWLSKHAELSLGQ